MTESAREELLAKALEVVSGNRQEIYGNPADNHQRIAWLWTIYIMERGKKKDGFEIEPRDTCIMMLLVKIARLMETPGHFDSLVDVAGYASIAWELEDKGSEYRDSVGEK